MCGVCLANEVYDLITWPNVQNITNSLFVRPLYEIPNINQMTLFQAKTFPNSNYLYCTAHVIETEEPYLMSMTRCLVDFRTNPLPHN